MREIWKSSITHYCIDTKEVWNGSRCTVVIKKNPIFDILDTRNIKHELRSVNDQGTLSIDKVLK